MRHAETLRASLIEHPLHLDAAARHSIFRQRRARQQLEQRFAFLGRTESQVRAPRRGAEHGYTHAGAVAFEREGTFPVRGLADHHGCAGRGRYRHRPHDLRAEGGEMRFGDMRNHGLIVKAFRQGAHHDGRSITVIVRVADDISRQAQGLQNPVGGRARQPDRDGQRVDGGPLQAIQFGQHVESAVQSPDRSGRFTFLPDGIGKRADFGIGKRADFRVHHCIPQRYFFSVANACCLGTRRLVIHKTLRIAAP
jgi:hypothetical protein